MMRIPLLLPLLCLAAWTPFHTLAFAERPLVPVGVAEVDITPDYPVRLSGYGNRRTESDEVEQRIWAKALAIGSDEQGPAVLLTVDNCGVPASMTDEVSRRLSEKKGIPRSHLAICSSHTHAAPMLTGVLPLLYGRPIPADQQARIDRYTRELTDQLEQVALAALKDRQQARLDWAVGEVTFAMNRRRWGGPVDHRLPALRVTGPEGSVRAVLARYACHCTTMGGDFNRIFGDWAGYAQEALEREFPGAIAMVAIGCGADAKPRSRGTLESTRQHGEAIAAEVKRLFDQESFTPIAGPVRARVEQVELPFDELRTEEEWLERAESEHRPTAYHAQVHFERLDRGKELPTSLSYPVQTWTFDDDLAMVFLAGEVVGDYAVRLAEEFDDSRLWINAYANDVPCYIASKRVLRQGGYEADTSMIYYDQPNRLAPEVEDRIVDAVQRLLPAEFYSERKQREFPPPKSPDEALMGFRHQGADSGPAERSDAETLHAVTTGGMTVELVAAEPLVIDPVAIDFGTDGRLWVVEYFDYPTGLDGNYQPGGRIKYLEDTDGDGRYDQSTLFLDKVPFPTGVMQWRDGVLVASAPDILYAEDTDGDGRADVRRVLFTGFGDDNFQARVNGFRYGLDNWVHGSSGRRVKTVQAVGFPNSPEYQLGSRDFRMNPDTGELRPVAGGSQYGRMRDDWGNWFGNSASSLLYHYPFPNDAAQRNPHVPAPSPRVFVPSGGSDSNQLFPVSRTLTRFNNPRHFNRVTSACGPGIYRDVLLGDSFFGDAFICEPVHNLVTRLELRADGMTFTGQRAEGGQDTEFLASTDNWFRPSQVRTGPDGALWVADMYRFVIEHPRWIGPDRLAKLDVRAGDDKGRIYRIFPAETAPRSAADLTTLPASQLAGMLDSPGGPLRDLIQRELVQRQDQAAADRLVEVALQGRWPAARVQALWTLQGLAALSADTLQDALDDPHSEVRRSAVRLSGQVVDAADPQLVDALLHRVDDPEKQVRYELALVLADCRDGRAGGALGRIARRDGDDPYVRAAVLSSAVAHVDALIDALLPAADDRSVRPELLQDVVKTAAATDKASTLNKVLDRIEVTDAAESDPATFDLLAIILDAKLDPELQKRLEDPVSQARRVAADKDAAASTRRSALQLLGRLPAQRQQDLDLLSDLLSPRTPRAVQTAAVAALERTRDDRVPALLLRGWRSHVPQLRTVILDTLLQRPAWSSKLLDAIDDGQLSPSDLDASRRERLVTHSDSQIRERAERLLAAATDSNRQEVLDAYLAVDDPSGDPAQGQKLFAKHCGTCHRFQGEGEDVGPDLDTLTDRSPSGLLTSILDPNRAVEPKYVSYAAVLEDGRVLTGRLAEETANTVTLLADEAKRHVILRSEVDTLASSGKSLMPEGLEKDLPPEDMAHILAYLTSAAAPPKNFPGNQPETVAADANGVFTLLPNHARIYGTTLVQGRYRRVATLSEWLSTDDRAAWELKVEEPGPYEVWVDWLCEEGSSGNQFALEVGQQKVTGTATETKTEEDNWFRTKKVGQVELSAGSQQITLRRETKSEGRLFQLRMITLLPAR